VAKTELTGKIGKPMLTLHGTLDALLPIRTDSDVYARMIQAAGRGELHRYYTVEAGSHVDGNHDVFKSEMRPILPCYRQAFIAMEAWVEKDAAPPDTQFVPRPAEGDVINECTLKPGSAKPGAGNPPTTTAPGGRAAPRGLTASVAPSRDRRAPFRFTVSGRLVLATGADAGKACSPGGRLSAQVKRGGRTIALKRAKLKQDCTYRIALKLGKRSGRRLAVFVRFHGNRETAPAKAAVRYVRLG
jgi:hypothetical protein